MIQSIYKRKDGRWEGYVIYNNPDTGEDDKKSFYGAKRQEVNRKLSAFIDKIEAGDYSDVSKVTLEGWLKKFLDVYCAKRETTTKEGYKRYIDNHITPFMGKLLLKDIKPIHIERFYNHERTVERYKTHIIDGKMVPIFKDNKPVPIIKNGKPLIGYSEKTILQIHRILHKAFKKAIGDGIIARNPCDSVDSPSPEDYEPVIYTEEQFLMLLDKIETHRMAPLILIAGMCGLRRGELLGLTWEDIDLENGTLSITKNIVPTSQGIITKKPKTKKSERTITIPSAIIPILKTFRGIGKVYTKIDGNDYNPGSVSRAFKQLLIDNNLPHIRLHDLRHFNATMMLKNDISEREAQERLGHSNPGQTKKYQHILKDMDKKSADKLNNILKVNSL